MRGWALLLGLLSMTAGARGEEDVSLGYKTFEGAGETAHKNGGCGHACCQMCPCWYGGVDLLLWNRHPSSCPVPRPLAVMYGVDPDTGEIVPPGEAALTAQDLAGDIIPGIRVRAGKRISDHWALEGEYLGLFSSQTSASAIADPFNPDLTLALPGELGLASNVFFGADQICAEYDSNLHSVEINLATCCSSCAPRPCHCGVRRTSVEWLVGFRYLSYAEDLDIYGTRMEFGGSEDGQYGVRTRNDLLGGQVGARYRNCWGRLSWEAMAKAGLFANFAKQSQRVTDFPDFELRPLCASDDTNAAWVGELGLSASYQLTDVWSLRAGYGILWLSGVALAPDQLDYSLDGGTLLANQGTVFYHGCHVGLEARW